MMLDECTCQMDRIIEVNSAGIWGLNTPLRQYEWNFLPTCQIFAGITGSGTPTEKKGRRKVL